MIRFSRTYACMNNWCPNYQIEHTIYPEMAGPYLSYPRMVTCVCCPAEVPIIRTVIDGQTQEMF